MAWGKPRKAVHAVDHDGLLHYELLSRRGEAFSLGLRTQTGLLLSLDTLLLKISRRKSVDGYK